MTKTKTQTNDKKIAVIDIGSNTVRLVVFDTSTTPATVTHNEKHRCRLGQDLQENGGKFLKDRKKHVLSVLKDFAELIRAEKIGEVRSFATAAVRDAKNGKKFMRKVEKIFTKKITGGNAISNDIPMSFQILSGKEEAYFAAHGVLYSFPEARGLVADLGGSSLELANIKQGKATKKLTLPIGGLAIEGKRKEIEAGLRDHFAKIARTHNTKGGTLYAVGGNWRALVRAYQIAQGEPRGDFKNRTYNISDLSATFNALSQKGAKELRDAYQVDTTRTDMLPGAAITLMTLANMVNARTIVFSHTGAREGVLSKHKMPKPNL
jgi:exopolyphosphatase/guanosine-5'-triphosphate,3'-diphosphate pyrophosphatase